MTRNGRTGDPETPMANRITCGGALETLLGMDSDSVDCVMTSPPYWGQREYAGGGIGNEKDVNDCLFAISDIFCEIKRVLKPEESAWLNIGDKYLDGALLGLPWMMARRLTALNWTVRQEIIWNKLTGFRSPPVSNRLRVTHEHMFHLTLSPRYYWNAEAIQQKGLTKPSNSTGDNYLKQIRISKHLSTSEKTNAAAAVKAAADKLKRGQILAFRLKLRGQHQLPHGHDVKMDRRGFIIIESKINVAPTTVFETYTTVTDSEDHTAAFPLELTDIPIRATCPEGGIILDPFCGSGTVCLAAQQLGRKFIGIDISAHYFDIARRRVDMTQITLEDSHE